MTMYNVWDKTTGESATPDTLSEAKKWIKARLKLGHDAGGAKTKVYSNGDWIPGGAIEITGSNKMFVANTRMTKANY